MYLERIMLNGLRGVLRKFDNDGGYAFSRKWSIGRGISHLCGYNLAWELSYLDRPIIRCKQGLWDSKGELENYNLSDEDFKKICKVIMEEYPDTYMRKG